MTEYLTVIDHDHSWTDPIRSTMAGTWHRPCSTPFCKAINLDLSDETGDDDDN